MHIESLGMRALFLIPSTKVFGMRDGDSGHRMAKKIHDFLVERFTGFTMASGNICGYFEDNEYDEHREYRVAIQDDSGGTKLHLLQEFLAEICAEIEEVCIYLEYGGEAMLIYPKESRIV
ncbi:MAG: hypothetical protein U9Q03_06465 [Patescibacteria group bacterium]|nr:hypothetical protein [Patescibacteria group bacterium]